jgi:hypothetical protein
MNPFFQWLGGSGLPASPRRDSIADMGWSARLGRLFVD